LFGVTRRDIADHLIEPLDAARRARWVGSTARMNFTHSSQKSWALLRRLGAAQRPPQSARPLISANKVASHLVQVPTAPANKYATDGTTHVKTLHTLLILRQSLGRMNLRSQDIYHFVHPEFIKKYLGPKVLTWLAHLFTRMI